MTLPPLLSTQPSSTSLKSQLLLAMPAMTDPRFNRTVVYICAHSSAGAMGLIINRPESSLTFRDLLVQLEILTTEESFFLSNQIRPVPIVHGGPVEIGRGFVLHSSDFFLENVSIAVDDSISLTASIDILKAIAEGRGPQKAILALGYAGWSAGQLENEILSNTWLQCGADSDFLFDADFSGKYLKAFTTIGIDPQRLSSHVGHA